jgi:hypothetical protein
MVPINHRDIKAWDGWYGVTAGAVNKITGNLVV